MSIYLENSARNLKNSVVVPIFNSHKVAKMLKIIHFLIKSEQIEVQKWLSTLITLENSPLHTENVIKVTKGHLKVIQGHLKVMQPKLCFSY